MSNKNRLAVNMIAQITAFLVNTCVVFFVTPFVVENIGSSAFGFIELGNNFTNYAQIIAVALNSMAGRFITISIHQKDIETTNKYFTSIVFANIALAIIMSIPSAIIIIFMDKIFDIPTNILVDVKVLWGFIFLNFLISIIGSTYGIATFAKNRLDLSSFVTIQSSVIRVVVLLVVFYFFKPSVWYIGLATFLCSIYILIWNIYYTRKMLPYVKVKKTYFDIKAIITIVSSGAWNSFSRLSGVLSNGLDLLIANLFVGGIAMGTLSLSKTVPTMILSIFAMLASVFSPQLTISYAKGNYDDVKEQLISSVKLLGTFATIPTSILFVYGESFYSLWVPSQDARLIQYLSIAGCLGFVFALPLESMWNIFVVTNKVKVSSIFIFINSLLSTGLVFLLLYTLNSDTQKLFVIVGVSSIFSIVRALTFLPIYGAKCLNLKWTTFYPVIIKNFIGVVTVSLSSLIIKENFMIDKWSSLVVACLLTAMIGLTLSCFLILGKSEREVVIRGILRVKEKIITRRSGNGR
ncbi:hypothetical protein R50345_24380 [Paenibacillus sp. FSL R5-0345]|uniref:oligosaccharide flippase family protein n=1 Tax=Paenibacillus sp. FSL R5-0345 TaxID=1536770 RepID=UPI0004F5A14D|nr:oligosaccharide flippase family protein [Paenibacillus sp. FSL R5-0345]AIQ37490.1 hypothetical protein R50345_24380 [Paenibacillus sp. FSL R5-0345]